MKTDTPVRANADAGAVDLKARYAYLYRPSSRAISVVDVPTMPFLMLDGTGDPNTSPEYRMAIEALYGLAYTVKFLLRREQGADFRVMPLEGLWWSPTMEAFSDQNKSDWSWTMMIAQPESLTPDLFEQARAQARQKKASPALERARLESFHEGLAAQIMYIGPFAAEGPTIVRLHAYIRDHGYTFDGRIQKHHEIYLSDPRRASPDNLRTIIRQPMIPLA